MPALSTWIFFPALLGMGFPFPALSSFHVSFQKVLVFMHHDIVELKFFMHHGIAIVEFQIPQFVVWKFKSFSFFPARVKN